MVFGFVVVFGVFVFFRSGRAHQTITTRHKRYSRWQAAKAAVAPDVWSHGLQL